MFTITQIKTAHAKVASGADFPAYIQELVTLGVTGYETYVTDGHTDYHGKNNYTTSTLPAYDPMVIADETDAARFRKELKEHQQGLSGYPAFCSMSAATGIEKWVVDMFQMTCTYFDKKGNTILVETIPQ